MPADSGLGWDPYEVGRWRQVLADGGLGFDPYEAGRGGKILADGGLGLDPYEAGSKRRCDIENKNPPSKEAVGKKLDPKPKNPLDSYFFLDRCTSLSCEQTV